MAPPRGGGAARPRRRPGVSVAVSARGLRGIRLVHGAAAAHAARVPTRRVRWPARRHARWALRPAVGDRRSLAARGRDSARRCGARQRTGHAGTLDAVAAARCRGATAAGGDCGRDHAMLTTPVSLGGPAPRPVVPTAGAARGGATLRWLTQSQCPADWWIRVERCGGGFFHTPPGLDAGAPAGEPVFAQLWHGDEVVGVATGVRSRCRFGREPRHLYFPTVPALTGPPQGDEALGALVDTLRAERAVEVTVDSFDAGWQPHVTTGERVDSRDRVEYLVPLDADPDELARR